MTVNLTPGSVGITAPLSAINRFPYFVSPTGPIVDTSKLLSKQDEVLWRISRNSHRLRGGREASGALALAKVGRSDALKALLTRYGIIPIQAHPGGAATLHTWLQCFPAHRGTETVTVVVDAANVVFNEDGPAIDQTYGSSGLRGLAASSSADASAVGRTQVVVP